MSEERVDIEAMEEGGEESAAQVEAMQASLEEAQRELKRSESRRVIELALVEAGALDVEAARVLIEHGMGEGQGEGEAADAPALVEALKSRRPYLFRRRPAGASALSARLEETRSGLEQAAEEALRTGDTGALLRYLRLRRNG